MATILTAVMLIAATAGILFFFLASNKNKKSKQNKSFLRHINDAGAAKGLNFSSQEILINKIIGLDGQHRKLMVLEFFRSPAIATIDLAEVKDCRLIKTYTEVNFGNPHRSDIERELETAGLQFNFNNNKSPFHLSFYDRALNSIYEMAELEKKIMDWEVLVSKLLVQSPQIKRPAQSV